MKFLIDAQLPPRMAAWLRTAGHEADHVDEIGLRAAEDDVIWRCAKQSGACILTKDEDFAARAKADNESPIVIWRRIGNCPNARLQTWLEPRREGIVQMANEGSRIIEVI